MPLPAPEAIRNKLTGLLATDPPRPGVHARLERWRALSAQEAPTGEPREYLSFCGALALSAAWPRVRAGLGGRPGGTAGRAKIIRGLRAAVADARWRMREAAALAHPPLLRDPAFAREALALAEQILKRFAAAKPAERREEDFRVLRQGLGYALSVLAAAEPQAGFAMLERWAARKDPDVAWILQENLKKKRLARWPERVRRLLAKLGGS